MRVLAIDVSVSGCSVAILDTETTLIAQNRLETDRGQAEFLIPIIEETIQSAKMNIKDLDCIAVTRGPGSFTGVRIGLAAAKTLGLALDIPVYGFSTLDVIAKSHNKNDATLFLIDTKRDDFYGQVGSGSVLDSGPKIWSNDEVASFAGEIIKDALPDITVIAKMGAEAHDGKRGYDTNQSPAPLYLRGAEVSESKKKTLNIL